MLRAQGRNACAPAASVCMGRTGGRGQGFSKVSTLGFANPLKTREQRGGACQLEPLSGISLASHSLSAAAQMSRSVLDSSNSDVISSAISSGVSTSGSYAKSIVRRCLLRPDQPKDPVTVRALDQTGHGCDAQRGACAGTVMGSEAHPEDPRLLEQVCMSFLCAQSSTLPSACGGSDIHQGLTYTKPEVHVERSRLS